jgi:hypothetical protein
VSGVGARSWDSQRDGSLGKERLSYGGVGKSDSRMNPDRYLERSVSDSGRGRYTGRLSWRWVSGMEVYEDIVLKRMTCCMRQMSLLNTVTRSTLTHVSCHSLFWVTITWHDEGIELTSSFVRMDPMIEF